VKCELKAREERENREGSLETRIGGYGGNTQQNMAPPGVSNLPIGANPKLL